MNEAVTIDAKNPEQVFLSAMHPRAGEPAWLAALRGEGKQAFATRGLPSKRVEAWKYSDLRRIVADAGVQDAMAPAPVIEIADAMTVRVTGGRIEQRPQSLPQGLSLSSLRDEIARAPEGLAPLLGHINTQSDDAIGGLNMALWADGLVLRVDSHTHVDMPLHVAFDWNGEGHHLRFLILLERGAALTLIESHAGEAGGPLSTLVSEVRLAPDAHLTHLRLERFGAAMRHATVLRGEIAADACFDGALVSEGANFARRETRLRLQGPRAEARLTGLHLLGAHRQSDDTVVIEHAAPRCTSRQAFRAVVKEEARSVVQGRISVGIGAVKTDGRQSIKGLLLSRRAEMDAKPELEILADDVACAHGTAIGELDANALFYLRTRGIPEDEARGLLVEGFLDAALDDISNARVRELAEGAVADWMSRERGE